MRFAIQARLDYRSQKRLAVLVRELGWSPSQVVREGLRVLEASHLRRKKRGVIGLEKVFLRRTRSGLEQETPARLRAVKKVLLDSGVIVALLDRSERFHQACVEAVGEL